MDARAPHDGAAAVLRVHHDSNEKMTFQTLALCALISFASLTSCESTGGAPNFDRGPFRTEVEDGRLWVMQGNQQKSDKHVTLIGKGPGGMTIKAPDKDTAYAFLAYRKGFVTEIEDGRLWVLRDGQEKAEKHVTVIGKGPAGLTIKALDRETIDAYLAAGS